MRDRKETLDIIHNCRRQLLTAVILGTVPAADAIALVRDKAFRADVAHASARLP